MTTINRTADVDGFTIFYRQSTALPKWSGLIATPSMSSTTARRPVPFGREASGHGLFAACAR